MILPNFLILGEMKSGTSALYYQLRQHPDIYMDVKEIHYFTLGLDKYPFAKAKTLEEYANFFVGVNGQKAVGEDSPSYLAHPEASQRIKSLLPDVKMVAVLRDPVERAYSHFWHERMRVENAEPLDDFLTAFHAYDHRWSSYKNRGFYYQNLMRYKALFDWDRQIKPIIYDDYRREPVRVIQELFEFLEVDPTVQTEQKWYWKTGVPKNKALLDLMRSKNIFAAVAKLVLPGKLRKRLKIRIYNSNLQAPPPLDPQIRADLIALYRDDILHLQDLLKRDLANWLQ